MPFKFFRRPSPQAAPSSSVPDGERIYAIGDIHGRHDLLTELLAKIAADDKDRGPAATRIIFLGDLVDRGPESAQVVDTLLRLKRDHPNTHFLLGNHEEVFLEALKGDEQALKFFIRIGGRETILSYGISPSRYTTLSYSELQDELGDLVPAEHIEFLSGFEDMVIVGDYAFVHAGIRPGKALPEQKAKDLRWIREEFLNFNGSFEKIIVHGHTITERAELLPHRIGLDTGAYASGRLSGMGFEGNQRWLLQTGA
jgi:serine/threonine protein phosphatase 1